MFGNNAPARRSAPPQPSFDGRAAPGSPWGGQNQGYSQNGMPTQSRGGGSFLAGAAQTAMGVAGGVLLGNAIGGMFGADKAQAATPEAAAPEAEAPAGEMDSVATRTSDLEVCLGSRERAARDWFDAV